MTTIEKTLTIDDTLINVFNKIFEDNECLFESEAKILEWKQNPWKIKRKILQRKEEVYAYINDLPDEVVGYTTEGNKNLRLGIKNKMLIDQKDHKKIKTKFKILNVNPFLRTILNDLQVIKIKNITELKAVDENRTDVKIYIFIKIAIPKTKALEQFIAKIIDNIMNNILMAFQKN